VSLGVIFALVMRQRAAFISRATQRAEELTVTGVDGVDRRAPVADDGLSRKPRIAVNLSRRSGVGTV
jgi:hypothetical protein